MISNHNGSTVNQRTTRLMTEANRTSQLNARPVDSIGSEARASAGEEDPCRVPPIKARSNNETLILILS